MMEIILIWLFAGLSGWALILCLFFFEFDKITVGDCLYVLLFTLTGPALLMLAVFLWSIYLLGKLIDYDKVLIRRTNK